MRPTPELLAFFLEAKEDSWTILKAFFHRDGESAKLHVIGLTPVEVHPEQRPEPYC